MFWKHEKPQWEKARLIVELCPDAKHLSIFCQTEKRMQNKFRGPQAGKLCHPSAQITPPIPIFSLIIKSVVLLYFINDSASPDWIMVLLLISWWPGAHHLSTSVSLDSFLFKKRVVTGFSLSVGIFDMMSHVTRCHMSHDVTHLLKILQRLPISFQVKPRILTVSPKKDLAVSAPSSSLVSFPIKLPVAMLASSLSLT